MMGKETAFPLRLNPNDRKIQVGGSDLPGGPDTYRALSSPLDSFLSQSYLHHLTGPDIVPGGARMKAAFLDCSSHSKAFNGFH